MTPWWMVHTGGSHEEGVMSQDRQDWQGAPCPRCGAAVVEDARFCSRCGRDLQGPVGEESTVIFLPGPPDRHGERKPLTPEEAAAIGALPPGSAFLISRRTSGAADRGRYLLDAEHVKIGRNPDNDICLDDITVSRHHLELHREQLLYFVHDLASLNGTYLNHDRVELAALHDGDEIRVGKYWLVYYGSQTELPRPAT